MRAVSMECVSDSFEFLLAFEVDKPSSRKRESILTTHVGKSRYCASCEWQRQINTRGDLLGKFHNSSTSCRDTNVGPRNPVKRYFETGTLLLTSLTGGGYMKPICSVLCGCERSGFQVPSGYGARRQSVCRQGFSSPSLSPQHCVRLIWRSHVFMCQQISGRKQHMNSLMVGRMSAVATCTRSKVTQCRVSITRRQSQSSLHFDPCINGGATTFRHDQVQTGRCFRHSIAGLPATQCLQHNVPSNQHSHSIAGI